MTDEVAVVLVVVVFEFVFDGLLDREFESASFCGEQDSLLFRSC